MGLSLWSAESANNTCGSPPPFPTASTFQPILKEYPLGTTVTYSCDFGYIPDNNDKTSQCVLLQKDAAAGWTEPEMSCIPRSCGDPGYVINGRRVGLLFTFPNVVTFECYEGYRIRGNPKRYCQASGSWSGKLPRCEAIFCDPPEQPKNGRVTYTSLEYGSQLQYECEKGFKPESDDTTFCTEDGTWSQTMDCVEVSCKVPNAPEYGTVELIPSSYRPRGGSIAVFKCEGERIADGPTTSKCLDIGRWTFPAPECLEPCAVPSVPNGKIGRWVSQGYGRSLKFSEIEVGTRLEDNEKLFLHCAKGYDPMGSENWQAMVRCEKGKWVEQPHCEPAYCRQKAPTDEHSVITEASSKHGSSAVYQCESYFKMIQEADVVCEFGEWTGKPPVCRDTRCWIKNLNFGSLKMGSNAYYRNGEGFRIECNHGYEVSKRGEGVMVCEDGSWNGPMPPCIAASCSTAPPDIEHGRVESYTGRHSSIVRYVCEDPYVLSGNGKVECLFGEWKGDLPLCRDSRCFLSELKHAFAVSSETEPVTESKSELRVVCQSGYMLKGIPPPLCMDGDWKRNDQSPCKESDCLVERIPHGRIQTTRQGDAYFNFRKFRWDRNIYFEDIPLGRVIPHSTVVYLTCSGRYTVHGEGSERVPAACKKGRWEPEAVCLITGTIYQPTTAAPRRTTIAASHSIRTQEHGFVPEVATASTVSSTTAADDHVSVSVKDNECSCTVTVDDENLVAYVDDRRLRINDRVEEGSVVKFRCNNIGIQRLAGPTQITCQNCRTWHSSEFPTCTRATRGDAVIVYEDKINVTLNGSLEILKREELKLICIAMEEAQYPVWKIPSVSRAQIAEELVDRGSDVLYVTHLSIREPDFVDGGWYGCSVGEARRTDIYISVIDPLIRCSKLPEEDVLSVEYEEELRVKSKAVFSCLNPREKLEGSSVLVCLSNGQWSDSPPKCKNITCRELLQTDLMLVSYTEGQKVGSFANFHCFSPGHREGVARTRCQEDGEWADPMPSCNTPPCSVDDLFAKIPQNVQPSMQDVSNKTLHYNQSVSLACIQGRTLIGDSQAKCGKDGQWIVGHIQCVLGCGEIEKPAGSNLMITPQRNVYRIGHSIAFSCPPGQRLTTDLEMIMCLSSGWSDSHIPDCEDVSEEEEEEAEAATEEEQEDD